MNDDSNEQLIDHLSEAHRIVEAAKLPESLQEAAFREVCRHLLANRSAEEPEQKVAPTRTKAHTTPGNTAKQPKQNEALSEADFFSQLERTSDVPEATLRDLFVFVNGSLEMTPRNTELGADSAARYRTVATLMAPALKVLESLDTIPGPRLKAIAEQRGASDPSRNYAKYVNAIPGYPYVGKRSKSFALRPGWEQEFATTINRVLGKDGE